MYFIGNIVLYNCFTNAYRELHFLKIMYHKIVGKNEIPNLLKWFALWSPELNQMICALRS